MTIPTVVLTRFAVAVAATSLVAGCSGGFLPGSGDAGPSASASPDGAAAMRAVATCLRSNGYPNAPDPVQDSNGNWGFPDAPAGAMPDRGTSTPCDDLGRRAKALLRRSDRERVVTSADLAKLRAFAACIRRQGVADWPDPDKRGDFRLPPRLQPPQGEAVMRGPSRTCESVLGGVKVSIVTGTSK